MPFEPGAPARQGEIALCVPAMGGNEWQYVKECLDSGWVSSAGPFVDRFEREFAQAIGISHAVATASGTAALHLALLVAGVLPDDEVLVSTLSFIAPANAIRYAGAWPIFIDAEPDYWQMDPAAVERFLAERCHRVSGELRNRETGRRVKAVLPVHILGHPVEMSRIVAAARSHGLAIVEDATESLGASYQSIPVGRLGDIACFSFNGNKLITTGGGGMIVTDDNAMAARARYLSTQAKDDPIEYVHHAVGYNYRLTNVQAAIGCAQLEHLAEHIAAKRRIATAYAEGLGNVAGVRCMCESPHVDSAFWLYTILIDEKINGLSSRDFLVRLHEQGIQARPLWQPLHVSPAHASPRVEHCPVAERLHAQALSLPSSVGLAVADQQRVINLIASAARVGLPRAL
jgi:perosamine synthetase